jgi:hypothetical protein
MASSKTVPAHRLPASAAAAQPRLPPASARQAARHRAFVINATLIYLSTLVLEAPLRMALSAIKLTTLLYARDLLAAVAIGVTLFSSHLVNKQNRNALLLCTYVLLTSFFASVALDNSVVSAGFGVKIFLTSLLGLAFSCFVCEDDSRLKKATIAIFVVTSLGVIANKIYGVFPWEGADFESAFGTSQVSKVWWVEGGVRRLAGLTRASTLAACAIGVTGAAMMLQWRNWLGRMVVFSLGIVSIYLTTSKGMVLAYAVAALIAFLPRDGQVQKLLAGTSTITYTLLILIAPFASWFSGVGSNFIRTAPRLLASFADRMTQSWPETFLNFKHWYQWLIGQGLGEVGISKQIISGMTRIPPTDNIHLYLYCNFGLIGTALFLALVITAMASLKKGLTPSFMAIHVSLGYGIIANIIDDAFNPIALCLCWGLLHLRNRAIQARA